MSPRSSLPAPRRRVERALAARIVTALGLALLLVVGAWSTSHGDAQSPATICLGSGASASAADTTDAGHHDEISAIDVLSSDAAVCAVAALCCIALVLLLRRLRTARGSALLGRTPRLRPITRAGPVHRIPALTLTQLSVSRT
ncbi:hypothetical protein SRABI76_00807 [Microbacterium oxydans]|uniref:Uncharacterized protein n=1 Tax=Microbacterium oxydans TaxID=82380 RepID=A0A0F0L9D7_9MICO|nr:hypothetical protein [Microbacterium oxydans]KJL29807.1 hypothetical protein RS83_01377 [Microbacterium oxydans]CAH0151656.1 hypothetical protein SRABI76_00807 [Microbacterium oxydans]